MTIILRPDQLAFVQALRISFRTHQSVLGMAPTGFGKTVTSAYIAHAAVDKGNRVLFTVHRKELVDQTAATFDGFGIQYGYIQSGRVFDRTPMVHIASIQTLGKRLASVPCPDLLVIDEAHLSRASTWHKVVQHFRGLGCRVLGNSGSPQRLDGKGLGDLFDDLVLGPSTAELIDATHLSEYRYFRGESPEIANIASAGGDFAKADLEAAATTKRLVGDIAAQWLKYAAGRRTVCFTVSHRHSEDIIAEFAGRGIVAAQISSENTAAERRQLILDFADGKIAVLCNVELITTGFDLASQVGRDVTVDCVILARPTQSLALYLQMVGRALRKKPYPAIILDHANNWQLHGYPDSPRTWSLAGEDKRDKKKLEPPPLECRRCHCCVRPPTPSTCPHCGEPWQSTQESVSRLVEYDTSMAMVEVSRAEIEAERLRASAARKREESSARTLEALVEIEKIRGYKTGWAMHRWAARENKAAARNGK